MSSNLLFTPETKVSPAYPALSGRALRRSDLAPADIESMRALLEENFHGVDGPTFLADLAEKNWVVLLEDESGRLRGFSTFLIYVSGACGRPLTVVCSGDTIVDPAAWGSSALPRTWLRALGEARRAFPPGECYWLLLTSGFRTYRFMSVFLREFHPRFDAGPQPEMRRMRDLLAAERFGDRYDPSAGLVRFPRPQVLRDGLREVPEGRYADPHVRFFLETNPGHADGDELVSLASLDEGNFTPAARRMARGVRP